LLFFTPITFAQDFSALDAAAGQALFERNWVSAPASTAAADGLGPYYNARSCARCHPAGAGGDNTLATMNLVVNDPVYGELLQLRALQGLKPEAQVELVYEAAGSVQLSAHESVALSKPRVVLSNPQHGALPNISSLRRAPSLAGLALLEQIPLAHLQLLADPHDHDGDGISGRLAHGAGRFGWKASSASLHEQTARALSLDLGLGTTQFPGTAGDCTPAQSLCIDAARAVTGDELEASDTVVDLLVVYLRHLPAPTAPLASGAGSALFLELGCVSCHSPQIDATGQTLYPFTDLLLHDMGPGLAAASDSPSAGAAEWRTAPLWDLGQVPRFLHDGRAANLHEAILWHGGEASTSVAAYRQLNGAQRAVLHQWLLGL
jgi:CxxC motif-containing protein (DUF1111 family)